MIVVYADGGGLGHLTRVQSLRHTLGLDEPITVLTASDHAVDGRVAAGLRVVTIPVRRADVSARRSWLQRTLADLRPSLLVVDAFPAGLAGEIDAAVAPGSLSRIHVARLLQWPAYRRILPARPLRYERTYVLEPLHPDHLAHVTAHSDAVVALDLVDPEPDGALDRTWPASAPLRWLITHTGPAAEVVELIAYARDQAELEGVAPLLVVATPSDAAPPGAPDVVHVDRYPVWPLFASADRIVTAAGFNAMRQLAPHRDRHRFLPMPRRFDDQHERARRARVALDAQRG